MSAPVTITRRCGWTFYSRRGACTDHDLADLVELRPDCRRDRVSVTGAVPADRKPRAGAGFCHARRERSYPHPSNTPLVKRARLVYPPIRIPGQLPADVRE